MHVFILTQNEIVRDPILSYIEDKKYKSVIATNNTEAKLKISNQKYDLIVLDMGFDDLDCVKFVESIRRKEELKNVKSLKPIIILGENPKIFTELFGDLDQLTFLQTPFNSFDFNKKVLSFSGKSEVLESNTHKVKKGTYLIEEGGAGHDMYWVIEGQFSISKLNKEGRKVIIGEVHPGELVGEMSFLDDLPRSASVKAEVDSEVLKIPHRNFMDVLDSQPRWFRSLMRTLSTRMRSSNDLISKKNATLQKD